MLLYASLATQSMGEDSEMCEESSLSVGPNGSDTNGKKKTERMEDGGIVREKEAGVY